MRLLVKLPDLLLSRALVAMLRADGHDARTLEGPGDGCRLRITSSDRLGENGQEGAVLVLRRGGDLPRADADPRGSLQQALAQGGRAVWDSPLDTRLLREVLRESPGAAPPGPPGAGAPGRPHPAPTLASAPHAWIVVDRDEARVVDANDEALALLRLPAATPATPVAELPVPRTLHEAWRETTEGLRTVPIGGVTCDVAWWTDAAGRVVVCFLRTDGASGSGDGTGRALARLGQMAATLAHEIRNPVASLAGALDLLETENDPSDRAEILTLARQRLDQLSRLLEKTLSLARPLQGPSEAVEMMPVIRSAVSTMSLHPACEGIEFTVESPAEPVHVQAFEGPLLQALLNLLLNAAQAQGGEGVVRVRLERCARTAYLRVHDDGPGIPPDRRAEVFQPFYTTKAQGTGLGLAEVRRLVEAVGGAIVVEDVDQGACFRLELPLAPPG